MDEEVNAGLRPDIGEQYGYQKDGLRCCCTESPVTTNDAYKEFAAEAQVKSDIDYPTLAALRGGEVGPLDHICPLCSAEDDQRLKLRTWDVSPTMISFYCVRCGASGYARATLDQLLHPERYAAETSAVIVRVKPKAPAKADLFLIGRLWDAATPKLPWGYVQQFHWRGIPIEEVPQGALRYHPKCPWRGKRDGCLVARYSDALTGELRGLWRRHDSLTKPMTLGPSGGCVIRLWPQEIGQQSSGHRRGHRDDARSCDLHYAPRRVAAARMGLWLRQQHGTLPGDRWHRAARHFSRQRCERYRPEGGGRVCCTLV